MSVSLRYRTFSVVAILVLLGIALFHAAPVSAQNDGTAPYTVKPGDTLKRIADDYGLTVEKLLAANPFIRDPNLIFPGQVLTLPVGRSEGPRPTGEAARMFVWQLEKDGGRIVSEDRLYLVRNGDTLERVARSYGLTVEKLLQANPQLTETTGLLRGELINIPYGVAENVPPFYQTPPDKSSK